MRKNRLLNIILTTIMLLSTFLTPQMAYALGESLNGDEAEVEANQADSSELPEGEVEEKAGTIEDGGGADSAEIQETTPEVGEENPEDEIAPTEDDAVADETPQDINNNDPPEANEEDEEAAIAPLAEIGENLLTSFSMTIIDNDGNQTVVENGSELEVDVTNLNAMQMEFGLTKPDEVDIAAGDTYTIDLPAFYEGSASNQPIIVEGTQVVTYSIIDGQVVITFDEAVNQFDNIEMSVNLSGNIDIQVFEEEQEVVVEVPFRDGTSYTATIRAEQQQHDGEDTKTAGHPYVLNEDGSQTETDRNPTHVDWTVRANDSAESFDQATIIDDLDDNLEIVEGSIVVEKIIRNYNNEEIDRESVNVTPTITENGFELNLGAIDSAYDISYTTRLIRPDGGGNLSVNNSARIILDGTETTVSDNVETSWSGDLPVINKEGQLSEDPHVINWQVEYNYGKEALGNVTLKDSLTHGEIDLDSVTVMEVDVDVDGNIIGESTPVSITPVQTVNGMTLPGLDADGKAYYITFSSTVPVGLNETVVNTISDDLEVPNSDEAEVPVNTIPTGDKVGEQDIDENGRPYIDWTITMNSAKVNVPSITIRDVFNQSHLEFDVDNNELYKLKRDGEVADNFEIEEYEHTDGRTGFKLDISDAGPHTYEFVYRTYYTTLGMQEEQLANEAELVFLDGDGEGIGEQIDMTADLEGPKAGIDKSGDYVLNEETNLQEIEWTVTLNNSKIMLEEGSTLTDTFTSGNYKLIDGSIELTTADGSEIDYSTTPNADEPGFVITLNEATNSTITVQFRTTADDTNNLDHINDATLTWQGGEETDTATVGKRDAGITKYGNVVVNEDGTKTVNWEINFNTEKNVIHDFKLTDNYTPTTVELSDITITADGQDVTNQFTISPERTGGTFTIETDKLDAVEYQLTYSTTLSPEEEADVVRNEVDITYTGGTGENAFTVPSPTLGVEKQANGIDRAPDNPVISWTIQANTDTTSHGVNLVDAILEDTIPEDQRLLADSIQVIREDGTDVTSQVTINTTDQSFSIQLPNGPYRYDVTFDTEITQIPSLDPEKVFDRYNNSTLLTNQTNNEDLKQDDDANASIRYYDGVTNDLTGKTGEQNPETENIDYELTINPEGLTIHNAKITDILSNNHQYIKDSIKVMDANGVELTEGFTLDVAEDSQSFEVTFDGGTISTPYQISYKTRLNPNLIGTYDVTNNVVLTGGTDGTELHSTQTTTSSQQWFYGGGGTGRTVDFQLNKQHDSGYKLSGAKFALERIDFNGNRIPVDADIITNSEGFAVSGDIRAGRYILTETFVPEAYQLLDSPIYLTIGYTEPAEGVDVEKTPYTVTITDSNWRPSSHSHATAEGNVITVNNDITTDSVSARKVWGRLPQGILPLRAEQSRATQLDVYLQLYRNLPGEEPEAVPGANLQRLTGNSETEEVTWDNIEQYAPDGRAYEFSVKEVDAEGNDHRPEGYVKVEDGLTVYNAEVNPEISGDKNLSGRDLRDGEFEFVLEDVEGNEVATATNDATGTINFSNFLTLTDEQAAALANFESVELTYFVSEKPSELGGITSDDSQFQVDVEISVSWLTGRIDIDYGYPDGQPVFSNSYVPGETLEPVQFNAHKTLTGKDLEADQYEFELLDAEGNVIDTKTNDENGDVLFDEITYDTAGTYNYKIREVQAALGGVTYDYSVFDVQVVVTDNTNGNLEATVNYLDGPANFTNEYASEPDSVIFEATKILEGQTLEADQFEFELVDENDEVLQKVINNAEGQIIFDEISFDEVGTHTYTIREVAGTQGGMSYDSNTYTVEVNVEDDGNGSLVATENYVEGPVVFTNIYETAPDSIVLEASKALEGQDLREGQFEFELVNDQGHTVQTVSNNAQGQIIFDEITYDETGEHTYTIREVKGGQGGITYDDTEHKVTVSVTDDGEGQLNAEIINLQAPIIFTNTYEAAPDGVVLKASKVLNGQTLVDGQFEFELLNEQGHTIQTVSNNAEGRVYFDEITYDEVGEHTYTIREVEGRQNGVAYDTASYGVTVSVEDDGEGNLIATANYTDGPATFTNNYTTTPGNIALEAEKILEGQTLQNGQFTFELVNEDGDVIDTTTNNAYGQIVFDEISYNTPGRHNYVIREVAGSQAGVTYDQKSYTVVVDVEDIDSQLVATANYVDGPAVFSNDYTPAPDNIVLEANKILEGQELREGQFDYELVDESREVIQTVSNNAQGQVVFDEISYDEPGKHTYIIREVAGVQGGMTYDSNSYTVAVDVIDNDGQLEATANYINGPASFTNHYEAAPDSIVLEASKILEGQELRNDQFAFELLDADGDVIQTATNNVNGQVIFDEITYEEVGEHTYTIREVKGQQNGVDYDKTTYEVTVRVEDDREGNLVATAHYTDGPAVFNNTYTTTPGNLVLEADKVLKGQDLRESQFEFELVNESGDVIDTATNTAQGQVFFDEITYDETGTYTYIIREKEGVQGGITYDARTYTVVVDVVDEDSQLVATANYINGPASFKNHYEAAPDSVVFEASKVLEGQELRDGQFEFQLVNEEGHIIQTVTNNANGQVIFDEITYDEVGEHTYTIREVEGNQGGVTYDATEHKVKVNVTDDSEGSLIAEIVDQAEPIVFTNNYKPVNSATVVFDAHKVLKGRDLISGQFTFELVDESGNVIQTATNNAIGQIIFDEITYDEAGTYRYKIREVSGSQKGITYDDTVYDVTVEVKDDGEGNFVASVEQDEATLTFTNVYVEDPEEPEKPGKPEDADKPGKPSKPGKPEDPDKPGKPSDTKGDGPGLPTTGVATSFLPAILALALGTTGVVLVKRGKKKDDEE